MGLDMYAYTVNKDAVADDAIDIDLNTLKKSADFNRSFAYWRKLNALHGWMEALYRRRGGKQEFNCVVIRVMPQDLDQLERDLATGEVKPVEGFFFGAQEFTAGDREDVEDFIASAREAIAGGKAVLYDSWW